MYCAGMIRSMHATAHAQESNMQSQAKRHIVSASNLDRRYLGMAEAKRTGQRRIRPAMVE